MSVSHGDGSLTIRSVRNTDIGRYVCHVVSVAGNDSASADLEVIGTRILYLLLFSVEVYNFYVAELRVGQHVFILKVHLLLYMLILRRCIRFFMVFSELNILFTRA